MGAFILVVTLVLAATGCAAAGTITPAELLSRVSAYDAQTVPVSGTVAAVHHRASHRDNPYASFSLCNASACAHVFEWGDPIFVDGETRSVRGTFATVKHVSFMPLHNEIEGSAE